MDVLDCEEEIPSPNYWMLLVSFVLHILFSTIAFWSIYAISSSSLFSIINIQHLRFFLEFAMGGLIIGISGLFFQSRLQQELALKSAFKNSLILIAPWGLLLLGLWFTPIDNNSYIIIAIMIFWLWTIYWIGSFFLQHKNILLFTFCILLNSLIVSSINYYSPLDNYLQ